MRSTGMRFTKMHAIGNDFVVLDALSAPISGLADLSRKLCHRRFGIGADQVLVLENSARADFRMLIFNADGSEVEMCGNGIRAFAKYVWDRGLSDKDVLDIETLAGIIRPARAEGGLIRVDMGEPILDGRSIPVNLDGQVVDHPITADGTEFRFTAVSMGNPHAVIYVDRVEGFDVERFGSIIEHDPLWPRRVNVEFVELVNSAELRMRVWERGAGETLACGTGATASAVASIVKGLTQRKVTVHLLGGDLTIEWPSGGHVFMTGPATEVFEGHITAL